MHTDKYLEPDDKNLTDRIYETLVQWNNTVATKWEEKTSRPRAQLENIMRGAGYLGIVTYSIVHTAPVILVGAVTAIHEAYQKATQNKERQETSDGTEKVPEFVQTLEKASYNLLWATGTILLAGGVGELMGWAVTKDQAYLVKGLQHLIGSAGCLGISNAHYMAQTDNTNPPPPPRRDPRPVPIPVRNSDRHYTRQVAISLGADARP